MPSVSKIRSIVNRNLNTISKKEEIEIAFFGGTFTAIPESLQKEYLDAACSYIKEKKIQGLRMSTHPEHVSSKNMAFFKRKGGRLVELGIQSLDKGVLKRIKRDTDLHNIKKSSDIIKKAGLKLGVQIMLGLPGDTFDKAVRTARRLIALRPETVRIYPTLVIKGTELEDMHRRKQYNPISLEDAIEQAAFIADIFEYSGVKVIRIGLHPSKDLNPGTTVIAGPYHQSFGEMVRARQTRNRIVKILKYRYLENRSYVEIYVPKNKINLVTGHNGSEKRFLEEYFKSQVILKTVTDIPKFNKDDILNWIRIKDIKKPIAVADTRMPVQAKSKLRKIGYYVKEVILHDKLSNPVKGHADMMIFRYKNRVTYEPRMEGLAGLLRKCGYICKKGRSITSGIYPKNIIYNACSVGDVVLRYEGRVESNIERLKCRQIKVKQGYTKCSIVPIDGKHIITSDRHIKGQWEAYGGSVLFIRPGFIKLPGYKSGFIGGASGVSEKAVFFVGRLSSHPDGNAIKEFIRSTGKGIIELYNGPLYDVGSILFFS